jgi:hypothetical protein
MRAADGMETPGKGVLKAQVEVLYFTALRANVLVEMDENT